ncbi:MAG: CAP domain-containing protein [Gaiellaceae bacterium]
MLTQLNRIRREYHLTPLKVNKNLVAAANQHSTEMVRDGYFAHASFSGSAFSARVIRFYLRGRSGYWSVGENLLWHAGSLDAKQAVGMWMASPEHRRNVLDGNWREIGVSSIIRPDAPGFYRGLNAVVITVDFGTRG